MASPVPAKSQPLHNFSLPHLKWRNHRSSNGGRSRLAVAGETSSSSPPHRSPSTPSPTSYIHMHPPSHVSRRPSPLHYQSPMRGSESESEPTFAVPVRKPSRKSISEKSTKPIENSKGKRSNKICIRFRKNGNNNNNNNNNNNAAVIEENHTSSPLQNAVVPSSTAEEEDSSPKIWNLRPRRPPINHKQSNTALPENQYSQYSHGEPSDAKNNDYNNPTPSKKHKFSISLSRDEIEEDIFSLTGAKPSRRPKKRPRTVQKQLDTLFPGLWLGTITADSYRVSEGRSKV